MTSHSLKRFSFILEEACCSTPITADSGDIAALVLLDPQRSVRYRSCEIRTHLVLKEFSCSHLNHIYLTDSSLQM